MRLILISYIGGVDDASKDTLEKEKLETQVYYTVQPDLNICMYLYRVG